MKQFLFSASGLKKNFGGVSAVNNVNLNIEEGQVFGLIGPNGAGKTTCFNLITGLYMPDAGQFSFKGKPTNQPRPMRLRAWALPVPFKTFVCSKA